MIVNDSFSLYRKILSSISNQNVYLNIWRIERIHFTQFLVFSAEWFQLFASASNKNINWIKNAC